MADALSIPLSSTRCQIQILSKITKALIQAKMLKNAQKFRASPTKNWLNALEFIGPQSRCGNAGSELRQFSWLFN